MPEQKNRASTEGLLEPFHPKKGERIFEHEVLLLEGGMAKGESVQATITQIFVRAKKRGIDPGKGTGKDALELAADMVVGGILKSRIPWERIRPVVIGSETGVQRFVDVKRVRRRGKDSAYPSRTGTMAAGDENGKRQNWMV